MNTITENLQILKNSTINIKQAIIDKGGLIIGDISTWDDSINDLFLNNEESLYDNSIEENDINFYDCNGTILYSYTKEEFLSLNELPELPSRSGLVCQGWNYFLDNAKEIVEEYGKLDIGATYITDDGKTRLYIRIAADGRMTVPFYFSQTVANGVTIDWGDGSATQTFSGTGNITTSHTYINIGDYCITFTVASECTLGLGHAEGVYGIIGYLNFPADKVHSNMLQKVELGNNILIPEFAFQYCQSLKVITIPTNITSIGPLAFRNCYSLKSLVIPSSVISIGASAFQQCYSLKSIIIPPSVIDLGSSAFQQCYSLKSIIFLNIADAHYMYLLNNCVSLNSVILPNSMLYIFNYMFKNCYSLSSITIPNSVISILAEAFYNCHSLSSVVIPPSVTSIGKYAFGLCEGVEYFDFSNHTSIPKLSNSDTFSGIDNLCKIVVPDSLYDTWKSTTNWSYYSSKIIKKSDWTK